MFLQPALHYAVRNGSHSWLQFVNMILVTSIVPLWINAISTFSLRTPYHLLLNWNQPKSRQYFTSHSTLPNSYFKIFILCHSHCAYSGISTWCIICKNISDFLLERSSALALIGILVEQNVASAKNVCCSELRYGFFSLTSCLRLGSKLLLQQDPISIKKAVYLIPVGILST